MSYKAIFSNVGDRERLLALGDPDQREREAVQRATVIRAIKDAQKASA